MTKTNKIKQIIFPLSLILISFLITFSLLNRWLLQKNEIDPTRRQELPTMSLEELSKFDGTDPQNPIYLAMDGYVFNVSDGREFYEEGGAYHRLAGKDSSSEHHLAGGSIIKRKYPIIAVLEDPSTQ